MKLKKERPRTAMYNHLLSNPPYMPDGTTRRIGASLYSNFWKGFDSVKPCYIVHGSFVEQAWRAGRDCRKKQDKPKGTM